MLLLLLSLLANINVFASELPCAEFQTYVKSSDVQAYSRKDGTQFSEAFRKEHCKDVYPGTKTWSESFKDTPLQSWILYKKTIFHNCILAFKNQKRTIKVGDSPSLS